MQYIIFVRHITGLTVQSSPIGVFIIIFILSCCSLALVPGLAFLIYKNEIRQNKIMNTALICAFVSAFIFCFYFNSYFKGETDSKIATEILFLIALVSISVYAVLKSRMHALYFNLISLLFIETDHRISPISFKAIDVFNNFVDSCNVDRYPQTQLLQSRVRRTGGSSRINIL